MKLKILFMFIIAVLITNIAYAENFVNIKKSTLSITFKEIYDEIKKQTDFPIFVRSKRDLSFLYTDTAFNDMTLEINFINLTIEEAIKNIQLQIQSRYYPSFYFDLQGNTFVGGVSSPKVREVHDNKFVQLNYISSQEMVEIINKYAKNTFVIHEPKSNTLTYAFDENRLLVKSLIEKYDVELIPQKTNIKKLVNIKNRYYPMTLREICDKIQKQTAVKIITSIKRINFLEYEHPEYKDMTLETELINVDIFKTINILEHQIKEKYFPVFNFKKINKYYIVEEYLPYIPKVHYNSK